MASSSIITKTGRPTDVEAVQIPALQSSPTEIEHNIKATGQTEEGETEEITKSIKSDEIYGYLLMSLAAISYTISNTIVRYAQSHHSIPSSATLFIRSITQTIFSVIIIFFYLPETERTKFKGLSRNSKMLVVLRGFLGGVALTLLYKSFNHMKIGDATSIFFTTPIITIFLSYMILKESIHKVDIVSTILSIIGILLIIKNPTITKSSIGIIYCLVSAFLTSLAYIIVRKLKNQIHFIIFVFSMGSSSTLFSIMLNGFYSFWLIKSNHFITSILFTSAIFGFFAQVFINKGLYYCRAGPGTLVRNGEVPLSYIVGLIFLNEQLDPIRLFGAFLVVLSSTVVGLSKLSSSPWNRRQDEHRHQQLEPQKDEDT